MKTEQVELSPRSGAVLGELHSWHYVQEYSGQHAERVTVFARGARVRGTRKRISGWQKRIFSLLSKVPHLAEARFLPANSRVSGIRGGLALGVCFGDLGGLLFLRVFRPRVLAVIQSFFLSCCPSLGACTQPWLSFGRRACRDTVS